MTTALKARIRSAILPFAERIVYGKDRLNIFPKAALLDNFFSTIKELGFQPNHVVDVGANHGNWTREALRFFPDAQFTLLEPQFWLKKSVDSLLETNSKVRFFPVGAGASGSKSKFTIANEDHSSTFTMSEEDAKENGLKQMEIEIVSLNEFIPLHKLPSPNLIKIDAEGLDLEVVKGASNYFGTCDFFLLEATVTNKVFDNTIHKVICFMEENGYSLFDITDLNRPLKPAVLSLIELVFVNKKSRFAS